MLYIFYIDFKIKNLIIMSYFSILIGIVALHLFAFNNQEIDAPLYGSNELIYLFAVLGQSIPGTSTIGLYLQPFLFFKIVKQDLSNCQARLELAILQPQLPKYLE